MQLLSLVLAYHALVTLAFSPMLMFAPERLMRADKKSASAQAKRNDEVHKDATEIERESKTQTTTKPKRDTKTLLWRICGIWVFYGGMTSLYATGYFTSVANEVQVLVAMGLMLTHFAESQVKLFYTGNQLLNLHVSGLLLLGLVHNYFM